MFSRDGFYMLSESREKQRLHEARGLFPNLDEVVNIIWRAIEPDAMKCELNNSCHIEKTFEGKEKLFIKTLIIDANFMDNGGAVRDSMATNQSNNSVFKINGIPFLERDTVVYDIKSDKNDFKNEFKSLTAHELTHAYEEFQRLIKGRETLETALTGQGYYGNNEWGDTDVNELVHMIRCIKYFFTKAEENAYLPQIRQDLLNHIKEINNSEEAYKFLKEKTMFSSYIVLCNFIHFLYNLNNSDGQEIALKEWNRLSNGHPLKTYHQLRRILKNTYLRQFKIFETKVSIMIVDLFKKYGNLCLVSTTRIPDVPNLTKINKNNNETL